MALSPARRIAEAEAEQVVGGGGLPQRRVEGAEGDVEVRAVPDSGRVRAAGPQDACRLGGGVRRVEEAEAGGGDVHGCGVEGEILHQHDVEGGVAYVVSAGPGRAASVIGAEPPKPRSPLSGWCAVSMKPGSTVPHPRSSTSAPGSGSGKRSTGAWVTGCTGRLSRSPSWAA